jgi:hypothetical protein
MAPRQSIMHTQRGDQLEELLRRLLRSRPKPDVIRILKLARQLLRRARAQRNTKPRRRVIRKHQRQLQQRRQRQQPAHDKISRVQHRGPNHRHERPPHDVGCNSVWSKDHSRHRRRNEDRKPDRDHEHRDTDGPSEERSGLPLPLAARRAHPRPVNTSEDRSRRRRSNATDPALPPSRRTKTDFATFVSPEALISTIDQLTAPLDRAKDLTRQIGQREMSGSEATTNAGEITSESTRRDRPLVSVWSAGLELRSAVRSSEAIATDVPEVASVHAPSSPVGKASSARRWNYGGPRFH